MISGIAVAAKSLCPGVLIVAAEPCGMNDAADVAAAIEAGAPVAGMPKPDTACDGKFSRFLELPVEAETVLETNQPTSQPTNHLLPTTTQNKLTSLTASLGAVTGRIVCDLVDECVVVSEAQIAAAMRAAWERLKVVVEPSGAAGLAAALAMRGDPRFEGIKRVGVILCGGNVDIEVRVPGFWAAWLGGANGGKEIE